MKSAPEKKVSVVQEKVQEKLQPETKIPKPINPAASLPAPAQPHPHQAPASQAKRKLDFGPQVPPELKFHSKKLHSNFQAIFSCSVSKISR